MRDYSGFVIKFDEPRRASFLKDRIERDGNFSENLSAPDWGPKTVEVCFLCLDEEKISFAALATRGSRSATAKYRIEFSDFVMFEPPLQSNEIERVIGERYSQHLTRSTSGDGGRVPAKTWSLLVDAIHKLRPDKSTELNGLFELQRERFQYQSGLGFEVMAQEKDATGLALEFSGFDRRKMLGRNYQKADKPAPFLKNLKSFNAHEDAMIFRDMEVFGDWQRITGAPVGMAMFKEGNKRVTIVNANRTDIEKTLGVDLVYYHSQFDAYVMVQYKRMERKEGDWVYRPDDQLDIELERMQTFQATNEDTFENFETINYRLNSGLFYLKLCPETIFELFSHDLIKGMYLPIDYYETLKKSAEMMGNRQGLRVSWNKTSRYLNNTLFIELVKEGWIGARRVTSKTLTQIIQNSLEGNKSLLLARETS